MNMNHTTCKQNWVTNVMVEKTVYDKRGHMLLLTLQIGSAPNSREHNQETAQLEPKKKFSARLLKI